MRLVRTFARVLALAALALPFAPSDAGASVSIAVGFDALVKDADTVAVITPGEAQSVWEDGRIFTYTKVHVDQGVAGDLAAGNDGYVRTMGGVVGKIGQSVDGEPVFTKDRPSLLFLRKFKAGGVFEVSARGQGQYPVVVDERTKARKLIRSTAAGLLLPPKPQAANANASANQSTVQTQSRAPISDAKDVVIAARLAHEVLHERTLEDGTREIAVNWKRLHAPALPAVPAPAPATK